MVASVAAVQQTADIYYQDREMLGEGMWVFSAEGLSIHSSDGSEMLKQVKSPMCSAENGCSYFDHASDGHKYVWAAAFGPNRIEVYDIETGDYVTYMPTCSTPLDLAYHPNTQEMWTNCAGTDAANGHDGHIDSFSTNTLHTQFEQIPLNYTGRAYGRIVVHSTLGNYGYSSVYKAPYLHKLDLATRTVEKLIEMPDTFGGYDMTYSPMNKHVFVRTRVTCTCGSPEADKESCGRGGPQLVDILTGPSAGAKQVNGTTSGSCEGSAADTLGVYEFDTVTDTLVGSHNIKEGTGFGCDPAASPDGKYIVLMGNDGGQNLRVLQAGENGVASTIVADVPVAFEGGTPAQFVVSDYAFVTNNDKTILVVAASTDNNVALIDMDTNPPTMRKLALTSASEKTAGSSRQVEWAIGTEYVWINGDDADEMYVVQIPGDDIMAATVASTMTAVSQKMLFVKNWERANQKQQLTKFMDEYFNGDPPAEPPAGPLPGLCFSGNNMVEVQDKGFVSMESLSIGDAVRVNGGKFSTVYSFGHNDKYVVADYLQIKAKGLKKPLELSEDHMLYVQSPNSVKAVAAGLVKVGDMVVSADGMGMIVEAINEVKRRGAFAPFTETGNVVVSGVVASNYVSLMETRLPVSMQWIAHTFNAPHRMICSVSFGVCEKESYTNGISNWVYGGLRAGQWLAKQSSFVQMAGSTFLLASLLVVAAIEFATPAVVLMLGAIVYLCTKKQKC